jgi:hypothetical protein
MRIRIQDAVTAPRTFENLDEAARSAVDQLLASGLPVRLRCSPSDAWKLSEELATLLAARRWGIEPQRGGQR